jgi:Ca2+-binding RTX toxin-like protein
MTVRKWGTEQLVNTTTADDEEFPTVVALQDGGYVVVWQDVSATGGDTSGLAVKMQRYDAFGNKVGVETLVNTTTASFQFDASVAVLADGTFVVCWDDFSGANGTGRDIRFRRFNADGTAIDASDVLATNAAGDQSQSSVVALPGGGFVISYTDTQSGSFDIFAQRFDAAGAANGGAITVRSTAANETDSQVAAFPNGSFVVAWAVGNPGQIFVQRVNANGTLNGAAVLANNAVGGSARAPDVAVLDNGGFVVVWADDGQPFPDSLGLAVRAQLFDTNGNQVGSEFTVNTLASSSQQDPNVVALPSGGFVVVYESAEDIRGQAFDGFGARIGEEFLINTSTTGTQTDPTIDVLADGRLVVTWEDQEADGDEIFAVRTQIIDPRNGSITGTAAGETLLGHDRVDDELNGLAGADTLNGLAGADDMYGGDDSDTYVVDNAGDRAFEVLGRGTDLVQASVSFALGANVENLTLTGSAAINGTGNALANVITGNAAANVLTGGPGTDSVSGGLGNDTYVLENSADVVTDAGGTDTITSTITRNLASFATIENLTLLGAAAASGTGNGLANTITGNNANNVLDGGIGNDTLRGLLGNDTLIGNAGKDISTGGAGNDIFRFLNKAHSFGALTDVVTDFDDFGNDRIDLSGLFGPALIFRGGLAFTAAGQARINDVAGADVIVEVNTGGSLAADFQLRLAGTTLASMTAGDFFL